MPWWQSSSCRQQDMGTAGDGRSLCWVEHKNPTAADERASSKENSSQTLVINRWDQPHGNDENLQTSWCSLAGKGINLPLDQPVLGGALAFCYTAHSYKTALLPCKDFTTIVNHIYVKVLFKTNSSLCKLGLYSQWSSLSLHCPEWSITAQKMERTVCLWSIIHGNKMWEDLTQMWDIMKQQGRECCTQSQCQPADQNKLPLVKEAAPVPPLPLLGQSQDVPFWVRVGTRHRNVGNNRTVDGWGLQPRFTVMFVCNTLLSLENRCKSVFVFTAVLHRSFTPPS